MFGRYDVGSDPVYRWDEGSGQMAPLVGKHAEAKHVADQAGSFQAK